MRLTQPSASSPAADTAARARLTGPQRSEPQPLAASAEGVAPDAFEGDSVADALLEQFQNASTWMARKTVVVEAGRAGEAGLLVLRAALKDPQSLVRHAAVEAVNEHTPDALALLQLASNDPDPLIRNAYLNGLDRIGDVGRVYQVDVLTESFLSESCTTEEKIVTLGRAGKLGEAALPLLFEGIRSNSRAIWRPAVSACVEVGPSALPLLDYKFDTEPDLSHRVDILQAAAPLGSAALPLFLKGFAHESSSVRRQALLCLKDLALEEVAPSLPKAVQDSHAAVREVAFTIASQRGLDLADLFSQAMVAGGIGAEVLHAQM